MSNTHWSNTHLHNTVDLLAIDRLPIPIELTVRLETSTTDQQSYIDPFASSPSSSGSSSPIFEMDSNKLRMLSLLLGETFIQSMYPDDLFEFYQSLTDQQWFTVYFYTQLALQIDRLPEIDGDLLGRLNQ